MSEEDAKLADPPTAETADDSTSGVKPPGSLVGPYRVIGLLGEGGMGRVYAAEHKILGRKVALKMLRSEYAKNTAAVARFFAEARAVNQIAHPNIIDITDFFDGGGPDGENFYVMELLQGAALKDLVADGPLPIPRSLYIAVQIANAIQAVHDAGIVHRDLKPANVFLITRGADQDYVKLLDFGVAKLGHGMSKDIASTATGAIVGTPQYMSPEQLNGEHVNQSSDVYAFGLLVYELVTGRRAFEGKGLGELAVKHLTARPKPPSKMRDLPHVVPADLEALILECLAKKPGERPASMGDVEARLRAIAAAERIPLDGLAHADDLARGRPAGSPWGAAAAALSAVAVVAVGWLAWQSIGSEAPGEIATVAPVEEPPAAGDPAPADPVAPAEPPPPPAPPERVIVTLSSDPPGATVRQGENGPVLGRTPLEAPLPYNEAPVELVFELEGHLPVTTTVRADKDSEVSVALAAAPKPPSKAKLRRTDVADPYE